MALIDVVFQLLTPCLLLLHWLGRGNVKKYALALLATSNVLLMVHSLFLIRQMIGLIQLARTLAQQMGYVVKSLPYEADLYMVRMLALILLPWLFLIRSCRTKIWLTLVLLVLAYLVHPPAVWNFSDLLFKLMEYLSFFTAAYALLWLRKALPFQTKTLL